LKKFSKISSYIFKINISKKACTCVHTSILTTWKFKSPQIQIFVRIQKKSIQCINIYEYFDHYGNSEVLKISYFYVSIRNPYTCVHTSILTAGKFRSPKIQLFLCFKKKSMKSRLWNKLQIFLEIIVIFL